MGVNGAWSSQVVIANQVIIEGSNDGLFVYNGAPALGNLIASIAATPGTDPYGNVYNAVFNIGNQQAAHFGVDNNGNVYIVNAANQNVIEIQPAKQAMFIYSGAPALGNLIVSLAAAAGTDSQGNAYPQGLNVTTGTISGSTFTGTDFIINTSGAFFYSSAPAAGNMVASIAAVGGADSFGNHYPAGINSQPSGTNGASFANLFDGNLFLGDIVAGAQDTANAALFSQVVSSGLLGITSPLTVALPSGGQLRLLSGQSSVTTGNANAPKAFFLSGDLSSDLDVGVSGTTQKCTDAGAFYTWQTPTAQTGWSIGTLQYHFDNWDRVVYVGSLSFTGTAVTAAGSSAALTAVPAGPPSYRPKKQWKVPISHLTSTSVQKNVAASAIFNTDGTMTIQWGDGMTGTTHDASGLANGDIFWIETAVPLGNIV